MIHGRRRNNKQKVGAQVELNFTEIPEGERLPYLPYLLMADESPEIIKPYIDLGDLFALGIQREVAGVMLYIPVDSHTIELKNIAIKEAFRGKGIGKKAIDYACTYYNNAGYETLRVGTANSSIENLAFYQRAGFRMTGVIKDFFLQYPEPIYENGIRALDMILFERSLG
ncbi:GNAT family N-acetyltransferase [Thalassobacillus hwangdonensis]|uniref:GNAT family N-acetyltransferase n=2 Tax=Thalassobacillus hwangdonensis TaxID=546108 RepID=A0ABW3L3G1_9BACI